MNDGRFFRRLGIAVLVLFGLFLLWQAKRIVLLAFVGLLLAVMLGSLAGLLSKRSRLGRRASLTLVILALLALLGATGWLLGPQLSSELSQLPDSLRGPLSRVEQSLSDSSWGRWLLAQIPFSEDLLSAGAAPEPGTAGADGSEQLPLDGQNLAAAVLQTLTSVITGLADIFFILVVGVFLAANPAMYARGFVKLFPQGRRERVREVIEEAGGNLRGWLAGQFISMLVIGVLTGLGLWLLGVPLAFALGFLAFLFEFIPIVGPWLAGLPAVLIALSVSPMKAVWVAVFFVVIQQLEGNIIWPLIQKRMIDLPPALTLVAIFFMASLFGLLGVLVATPLLAVVLVLVKMLYLEDRLGDEVELKGA